MSNFAYISGNPDNLTGGAAANMVDIQGPFVDLATWLNTDLQPRVAAAVPSFVTSLPVGATDGQEIYYQADAANGIIWHLRYNAGSASAYKWEFVGGSELSSEVITQETTTSSVYVALTTPGPSITLPLAGDYDVTIGTYATVSGAAASAYMKRVTTDEVVQVLRGQGVSNLWIRAGLEMARGGLTPGTAARIHKAGYSVATLGYKMRPAASSPTGAAGYNGPN